MDNIPSYPLQHSEQHLSFAFKTMQEIDALHNGQAEPPHRHSYYTIIWIEEAKGTHTIDFQTFELEPQTIYFVSPEQVHQLQTNGTPKGFALLFSEDFLQLYEIGTRFLESLNLFFDCEVQAPVKVNEATAPLLYQTITFIKQEYYSYHTYKNEVIAAQLKTFMALCSRLKPSCSDSEQHISKNAQITKDFKKEVEKHFVQWHKVQDYAELLTLSAGYLNEVIKHETGKTAKEIIQNRIILEAKRNAYFTDLSLKEIAYKLGFEDGAHFSKFFKNCQGMSFSDFKEQIKV